VRYLIYFFIIAPMFAAGTPTVDVFLPPINNDQMFMLSFQARPIVDDIFSSVGLKVRWHRAPVKGPGCSSEPMHQTILVALSWSSANSLPGAMAYSHPYAQGGSCVTIFMDRLRTMTGNNPSIGAALLGHVLAHEMGHVLQGVNRHSETGLLKERWSTEEINAMPWQHLQFTENDKLLILNKLLKPSDPAALVKTP